MENLKAQIENIKRESENIGRQIRQQTLTYILAGLGLITGLAWNEAIKALIEYLFPLATNTLLAKFIYAVLMTFVVVIITIYLTKLFKDEKGQQNE